MNLTWIIYVVTIINFAKCEENPHYVVICSANKMLPPPIHTQTHTLTYSLRRIGTRVSTGIGDLQTAGGPKFGTIVIDNSKSRNGELLYFFMGGSKRGGRTPDPLLENHKYIY